MWCHRPLICIYVNVSTWRYAKHGIPSHRMVSFVWDFKSFFALKTINLQFQHNQYYVSTSSNRQHIYSDPPAMTDYMYTRMYYTHTQPHDILTTLKPLCTTVFMLFLVCHNYVQQMRHQCSLVLKPYWRSQGILHTHIYIYIYYV